MTGGIEAHGRGSPIGRFLSDEGGNISMEFLLWLPVFLFVLGAVIEASLLFNTQADMWAVAREGALRMSMDEMTPAEAEAFSLDQLAKLSTVPFQASAYQEGSGSYTYEVMMITAHFSDLSVFRIFSELLQDDLAARVSMRNRMFPT